MFCKYCGATLPDGVKFCPSCGKQLGNPDANAPKAPGGSYAAAPGVSQTPPVRPMDFVPKPAVKVKKTYNIGNFIFWAGCALAALGLFLPYCSVSMLGFGKEMTLMEAEDGMYFLVIIAVLAVLNIFKLNIVNVAGSVFTLWLVSYENQNIQDYGRGLVDYEIGHTLLLFGSVVMLIAAIAGLVLWIMKKRAVKG